MIRKFITDSGFNFSAQFVALGFGIAVSVITARTLGIQDFGISAIVLLLPATIQALLGSGFAPTVIYMSASERWAPKVVIPYLLGLWLYLSFGMLVIALLCILGGQYFFSRASVALLLASLLLIPLSSMSSGLNALLSSNRLFKKLLVQSILVWPIRLFLVFVFVWWFDLRVLGVIAAAIGSGIATVVIGTWQVSGIKKYHGHGFVPELRLRQLAFSLHYGFRAGMGNVLGFLNYRADQFIIGGMVGTTGLGIYSVAVGLSEKLWLVANNLGAVLLPMVSSDQSSSGKVEKFTAKLAAVVLVFMVGAGAILFLLANPVVLLLYGQEYTPSATVLSYLLPGIVLAGPSKLFANYVAARGRPEINAIRGAFALCINIALNVIFIPKWGITGAAIATSISYGISSFAGAIVFYKISGCSLADLVIPSKEELRIVMSRIRKICEPLQQQ